MKIKLGMLDQDKRYMTRLMSYFNTYYSDKLEIFAFSSIENLQAFLATATIDVILADYDLSQGKIEPSSKFALAYFSQTLDTETIADVRAVCKYQKVELIYNEVLNLYAELDGNKSYKWSEGTCPVYLFMGVAGGVGTTTAAVASAQNFVQMGKRVLYLNLEENGVLEPFLTGEGNTGLSDALYAVKSNRANLALKLQTIVRKDQSGVCFFSPFDASLDASDMTGEDVSVLVRALLTMAMFDCIVVDADVTLGGKRDVLAKLAAQVFLVSDGREIANKKQERVLRGLQIIDERDDMRVLTKCSLLYNKFGSLSVQTPSNLCERVFGVINRYEGGTYQQVLQQICQKNLFQSLVEQA